MAERLALIEPTLTYERFAEADIVVEAVFEGMELKKQVFAELDQVARPDAILASNTSTLDIDAIASATARPQQVIGHHYFSPANVMRLLEIVRGRQTSPTVLATSMALAKRLGKVGVLVGNCRGFVGNRMFGVYQREAQFLVEEGARVEEVDAALVDFGMAMGPLAVGDLAGLDVGWRIRKEYQHLIPPGTRQPLVADQLCEQGRYGQKTGAGWYRYAEGSRSPLPDPDVERLIADSARAAGIERRPIGAEEIVERTIYALVNEGARILEEGFAARAVDIDIIYINGYGFPAHRGGPMWYADTVGLAQVLERIRQFERAARQRLDALQTAGAAGGGRADLRRFRPREVGQSLIGPTTGSVRGPAVLRPRLFQPRPHARNGRHFLRRHPALGIVVGLVAVELDDQVRPLERPPRRLRSGWRGPGGRLRAPPGAADGPSPSHGG